MFNFLKVNKIERVDTVLPIFSDTHSGSPTALFPLKQMELSTGNTSPTQLQRIIHGQFDEMINTVAGMRVNKRLITVFNADAIEGVHHNTKQIVSVVINDHKKIHRELMDYALRKMGHGKDDLLYYTAGTDSHSGEGEEDLARDLKAVPFNEFRHCHPALKLNVNGKRIWFAHQGANPGKDGTMTKGNNLRNKLKQIYLDCLEHNTPHPDYVIFSHFHHKHHEQIDMPRGTIDGFVLPSWQFKTDFALRYFPFEWEGVGGLIMTVSAEGAVTWQWSAMEFESTKEIVV